MDFGDYPPDDPYRPYPPYPPYRPVPTDPNPERHYLEAVAKAVIILIVFIINYGHLEWTRKQTGSWRTRLWKLLFVAFVPTYVLAELLVNLTKLLFNIVRLHSEPPKISDVLKDWRRYLCIIGGMYTVTDPDIDEEEATEDAVPATTSDVPQTRPALIGIRDTSDLRSHAQPWSVLTVARITLVVIASLAIIPLELLLDRGYRFRNYGIDKRYVSTAVGDVSCSLAALLILLSRSQWSLVHLRTETAQKQYSYNGICGRYILAVLLYELPLIFPEKGGGWSFFPRPMLLDLFFGPYAWGPWGPFGPITVPVVYFGFWAWFYWPQIQERTQLNWPLIWSCALTLFCIIPTFDLLALFDDDVTRQ